MASEGGMGEPAVKVQQFIEGWEAHLPESDITAEKKTLTSFVTENSNISTAMVEELEVVCGEIGQQQEALQCKGCARWYQWTCSSGNTADLYRQLMSGTSGLDWRCPACSEAPAIVTVSPTDLHSYAAAAAASALTPQTGVTVLVDSTCEDGAGGGHGSHGEVHMTASQAQELFRATQQPISSTEQSLAMMRRIKSEPLDATECPEPTDHVGVLGALHTGQPELLPNPSVLTYTLLEKGSQLGNPKLLENSGHSYTLKRESKSGVRVWRCSVRNKKCRCKATVLQRGHVFTRGKAMHGHLLPARVSNARLRQQIRELAAGNLSQSSTEIVSQVLQREADSTTLTKHSRDYLVTLASRSRQTLRAEERRNTAFEGTDMYIPDDFQPKKVTVDVKRHLLFVNDVQLQCLAEAKQWYVDVTTKALRPPYTRLLSLHTYVKHNGETLHVPLAFCLLSRARKKDYKRVLQELRAWLPSDPVVEEIVADFHSGLWRALSKVFGECSLQGCLVHWLRAVWDKVVDLELTDSYLREDHTHKVVQRLMALAFLPAHHVEETFQKLKALVTASGPLRELLRYMELRWVSADGGNAWPPEAWSVYGRSTRNPAEAEGWHHQLVTHSLKLPLSVMLHREALRLLPAMRPLAEKRVCKRQRKRSPLLQHHVFRLWELYGSEELSVNDLLKSSSRLVSPFVS